MTATPSAEMEVKLKPCPFCGQVTVQLYDRGPLAAKVRCDNCYAERYGRSPTEAIAAWNRRPSSSIRREALEEATRRLEARWKMFARQERMDMAQTVHEDIEAIRALANDGKAEGER